MAKGSLRVNGIIVSDDSEITASSGDSIVIREDDGSAVITVDTSGNVGINTTAPGAQFDIRGPAGVGTAPAGVLRLSTAETSVVDADQLGRIEFIAPLEAGGTDAILVGASIYAEADNTFAADNNQTELVFATGASEAAAEKMRLTSDGKVGIATTAPASLLDVRGTVQVGVDGTGHDVKFFGDTAGSFMLWDQSDDALELTDGTPIKIGDSGDMQIYHSGGHSHITNTTGVLNFGTTNSGIAVSIGHTTSETTINDNLTVTGNVGIGTTGPSHVVEIVHSNQGMWGLYVNGSAASSGIGAHIETATNDSGHALRVSTGAGASRFVVTNAGSVGIGTTAPSADLHVYGATGVPGVAWGQLGLTSTSDLGANQGGSIVFGGKDTASSYDDWAGIAGLKDNATSGEDGGYLAFYTKTNGSSAAERMRIDSSGNVGIGTNSPIASLDIYNQTSGTATTDYDIALRDNGSVTNFHKIGFGYATTTTMPAYIGYDATDAAAYSKGDLIFGTRDSTGNDAPDERMRITYGGKVGIGTAAPLNMLQIDSGTGANASNKFYDLLKLKGKNNTGNAVGILFSVESSAGSGAVDYSKGALVYDLAGGSWGRGKFRFCQNTSADTADADISNAKVTIDNDGLVGIGVTSPAMPLEIYKSGVGASNIRIRGDATTNDFGGGIYFTTDGNSTTNVAYIRQKEHTADKYGLDFAGYSGGLASRMVMTGDGKVGINYAVPTEYLCVGGTILESSSRKIKHNISNIENILPAVLQMQGVKFDYNDDFAEDSKNNYGFIAEDTAKVLPNVVGYGPDGEPSGIQYTKLTAVLLEAIKEQQVQIDELKSRSKRD